MHNTEIADHFSLLAKLMELHGENPFKTKSCSIAAYNIENLPTCCRNERTGTVWNERYR